MKQAIRYFGYFLALIAVVKLILFAGVLNLPDERTEVFSLNVAEAETPARPPLAPSGSDKVSQDAPKDSLTNERALLTLLTARKKELDERESRLKVEEDRLTAIKRELEEKINAARVQEEKQKVIIDQIKAFESKVLKDLARVYESTPPAKAGPMLEKLDIKTAAGITMNMKRDKAGALWAFISPQKAADITRELTAITAKTTTP